MIAGGYLTFMAKIIKKMITSKIVNNNFLTICIMLTFHKHSPFHRLGVKPVNTKAGITAGENTVKKSCLNTHYTTKCVRFQVLISIFNGRRHALWFWGQLLSAFFALPFFFGLGRREQNLQKLKNLSVTSVTRIMSQRKLLLTNIR